MSDLEPLNGWSIALRDVRTERAMQDEKWGEQNHAAEVWLAILSEEVGEMAKAMLPGGSLEHMRDEAVQVAAVAVAFVEAIDRARRAALASPEREKPRNRVTVVMPEGSKFTPGPDLTALNEEPTHD